MSKITIPYVTQIKVLSAGFHEKRFSAVSFEYEGNIIHKDQLLAKLAEALNFNSPHAK